MLIIYDFAEHRSHVNMLLFIQSCHELMQDLDLVFSGIISGCFGAREET